MDWSAYYDRVQDVVFWAVVAGIGLAFFADSDEAGPFGVLIIVLLALCTLASMAVWP